MKMKLILVLMIVLLSGNPIAGIELDSEEMFKAMMNEIKDLSGRVNMLELQNKDLSRQNKDLSGQNQDLSKRVSKLEHDQDNSKIQRSQMMKRQMKSYAIFQDLACSSMT